MTARKRITLGIWFVVSLFLDTAVLPRWNAFGLVPFVMLALSLSVTAMFSLQSGLVIGALGGLMEDLLCESMVGLTPALCLLAAAALHRVLMENQPKPLLLFLLFTALAFLVELLLGSLSWLIGMRFAFGATMVYGALPRAILTGLWTMAFMWLFRRVRKGQVDR